MASVAAHGGLSPPEDHAPEPAAGLISDRNVKLLLLLCVVAGLLPIWLVERFPSVDGPMHLYMIYVMEQLAQPGSNVFDLVFVRNDHIEPNFTIYGILWALTRIFPYLVAEKLFVSLYFALFAFSAYYVLRAFGQRATILSLLTLPLALGSSIHGGLYNYTFSMAVFLLAAGYAIRHLERLGWRHLAVLALLMFLLALTHLIGAALFMLYVGLARAGIALRNGLSASDRGRWKRESFALVGDGLKLLIAALPALLLIGSFLVRRVIADEGAAPMDGLLQKLFYIASISPIFVIDRREAFLLAPFVLIFWGLALKLLYDLWRDPKLRVTALPLLLPPAVLFAFLTFGTLGFEGFQAAPRILPFAFFSLVFLFGLLRLGRAWSLAIAASVVAGLLATSALRYGFYRQNNELYGRYAAAQTALPPGSAVVEFSAWAPKDEVDGHATGWRVDLTHYFRGSYARENGLILLNSKLLSPYVYGYFPVQYGAKGGLVSASFDAPEFGAPATPLRAFERETGVPIRRVSFWPRPDGPDHTLWILPEREAGMRRELGARWQLAPRRSPVAPYVYLPNQPVGGIPVTARPS